MATLAKSGRDLSNVVTSLFMLLTELIDRNGLSALSAFNEPIPDTPGMSSMSPATTTMKSTMFHPDLRYDFRCIKRPIADILVIASTVNTNVKTVPIMSST